MGAAILLIWSAPVESGERSFQAAALAPGDVGRAEMVLPKVLSAADVTLYREIFALQEDGLWRKADKLIETLANRILMGHVLAQRYLHPTKYRTSYGELKAWLAKYYDHPQARRLYKLALKRRPKNWKHPRHPSSGHLSGSGHVAEKKLSVPRPPTKRRSRAQRAEAQKILRLVRRYARKGWTKAIKNVAQSKRTKTVLSSVEYDRIRAQLGFNYFVDGRDDWALKWAGPAAKRSGTWVPRANWTAGLASWRKGRIEDAARHFEAMASAPGLSGWMHSAAAFWAARSHLVAGSPEKVSRWLGEAAGYPRTFYGILASTLLGRSPPYRWGFPEMEDDTLRRLRGLAAGERAMSLLQVNRNYQAERELRTVAVKVDAELKHGILALAVRADMPSLAMRLDGLLFPDGGGYDAAAYPLPQWIPAKGFSIDRALVFALVRQESNFNPKAKSYRGARGLMQLMPATASFVARDRRYRRGKRNKLHEPDLNLELGQKFIHLLFADDRMEDDLFQLAAAWNGGPGNLNKWRRRSKHMDDPLLFIECIPLHETRDFIERVLANLWIYRHRLGQPTPSLEAIAAGGRPVYTALDPKTLVMVEAPYGEDRR